MQIKKGQMITFAEGEYSDYCVNGLVVALDDFNLEDSAKKWKKDNTKPDYCEYRRRLRDKVTGVDFLPWLVSKGMVEDVDYLEVHTGCYGDVDITWDD